MSKRPSYWKGWMVTPLEFKLSSSFQEWQSLFQWKHLLQRGHLILRLAERQFCLRSLGLPQPQEVQSEGPSRRMHIFCTCSDQGVNGGSLDCNGAHTRAQITSVNNLFMDIIIPNGCHSILNGGINALWCELLDDHDSGRASIKLSFHCLSHTRQEIHEWLPTLLDKIVKVNRDISRSTGLMGLKVKISHLIKASIESNNDLNNMVNVCPVSSKRVKINVYIVFHVNSSLILSQVIECRTSMK